MRCTEPLLLSYILNSGPDIIGIMYEISYYDDVSF